MKPQPIKGMRVPKCHVVRQHERHRIYRKGDLICTADAKVIIEEVKQRREDVLSLHFCSYVRLCLVAYLVHKLKVKWKTSKKDTTESTVLVDPSVPMTPSC